MSTFYGTGIAVSDSTFDRIYTRNANSGQGSRMRGFRSSITRLLATTDVARMITLPSSARIWALWQGGNGAATAGAFDVGLYYAGSSHDGAVIDADYFATAIASPVTKATSEILCERDAVTSVVRGQTLWEMAALTADPMVYMDIVVIPSTTFTVTAPIVSLSAFVSLGD